MRLDDFNVSSIKTAIVSNGYNIIPPLQRCHRYESFRVTSPPKSKLSYLNLRRAGASVPTGCGQVP